MPEAELSKPSPDFGKWALVVGIDRYAHLDDRYQLEGCANDARAMAQVLIDRFGFPAGHVDLLIDEQATQAAIQTAMRDLAAKVGENDIVVFHCSGHGSQRKDGPEKDEADGLDETILSHDSQRKGPDSAEPNRDISDDDIHAWLVDIGRKTPYVTLIFDCCHSGTVARVWEIPSGERTEKKVIEGFVRVREVPPDLRSYARMSPALYSPVLPEVTRGLPGEVRKKGGSGWLPEDVKYTLIAGCKSKERSYEVRVFEEEDRASSHGALSFYLLRALNEAVSDTTYRDVFEQTAAAVNQEFAFQHPQLEGARDRQLFGPLHLEPMRFVAVESREGDTVTLAAGACCGLSPGSIWDIYGPGTRATEGIEPLGRVEIQTPGPLVSQARIVGEKEAGTIQARCRAVEVVRNAKSRRSLTLEGPASTDEAARQLRGLIKKSLLLRETADPGEIRVRIEDGFWTVLDGDHGESLLPRVPVGEPGGITRLFDNLEKEARYRNVRDLSNPGSALEGQVEMTLLRLRGERWEEIVPDPDGTSLVHEGERVAVRVRSLHPKTLYVQILDFSLGKAIQPFHPVGGGAEELTPGCEFEIGTRRGDEIVLTIPEEFPHHQEGTWIPWQGREILKLFVTTSEVDLSPLLQRKPRLFDRRSTLAALVGAAAGAFSPQRDFLRNAPPEDWAVIQRTLTVERKVWRP